MEFSTRRAWAWVLVVLFIDSWHLGAEADSFTSYNEMLWEVNITIAFHMAIIAGYFLFIKFYWKPANGMDYRTGLGSINSNDSRRLLYDLLARRRRAQ